MDIKALLMAPTDNVITCVAPVKAGETVVYRDGEVYKSVQAKEDIPFCHKIALRDFEAEEVVLKYGEMIGKTSVPISVGSWVSEKNIYSVVRDYQSELVEE